MKRDFHNQQPQAKSPFGWFFRRLGREFRCLEIGAWINPASEALHNERTETTAKLKKSGKEPSWSWLSVVPTSTKNRANCLWYLFFPKFHPSLLIYLTLYILSWSILSAAATNMSIRCMIVLLCTALHQTASIRTGTSARDSVRRFSRQSGRWWKYFRCLGCTTRSRKTRLWLSFFERKNYSPNRFWYLIFVVFFLSLALDGNGTTRGILAWVASRTDYHLWIQTKMMEVKQTKTTSLKQNGTVHVDRHTLVSIQSTKSFGSFGDGCCSILVAVEP